MKWIEYDPFGNVITNWGSQASSNHFRFSTKYFDEETGLYYYGYRYYTPGMGRWPSRDPVGEFTEEGEFNLLYGFVGNDPADLWDALGLEWTIDRGGGPTAPAECCGNDTVRQLAEKIGLDAEDYKHWLQPTDGLVMPWNVDAPLGGRKFEIPNMVLRLLGGHRRRCRTQLCPVEQKRGLSGEPRVSCE